jgi:dTDP-4-dehydrorhamnose reductase
MKIFITGSNGLLGQKLIESLQSAKEKIKIIAASKGENRLTKLVGFKYYNLAISDESEVQKIIVNEKPDVVINSAAITNVDQCEGQKKICWDVNVNAVKYLLVACQQIGAHFIHLSTDFIFNGEKWPYKESDQPTPLSYYGESKLAAENLVKAASCPWSIVMTLLVYGVGESLGRSNIVLWAMHALGNEQDMSVVDDQFRTPTLAEDLADGCIQVATQKKEGVYNISGKDYMSILVLIRRIGAYFNFNTNNIKIISSITLNQAAKRTPIIGFVLGKAISKLRYDPVSFEEGLAVVKSQMSKS